MFSQAGKCLTVWWWMQKLPTWKMKTAEIWDWGETTLHANEWQVNVPWKSAKRIKLRERSRYRAFGRIIITVVNTAVAALLAVDTSLLLLLQTQSGEEELRFLCYFKNSLKIHYYYRSKMFRQKIRQIALGSSICTFCSVECKNKLSRIFAAFTVLVKFRMPCTRATVFGSAPGAWPTLLLPS